MVLYVPAEGGEAHAHIQPGNLHPRDVYVDMGQDRLLQYWHVVQVPTRVSILLERGREEGWRREKVEMEKGGGDDIHCQLLSRSVLCVIVNMLFVCVHVYVSVCVCIYSI